MIGHQRLSLVVPARAFTAEVRDHVLACRVCLPWDEAVIAVPLAAAHSVAEVGEGVRVVSGVKGRGTQCNAGALSATGDLLLFLHDDTTLPPDAHALLVEAFVAAGAETACFRLRFDMDHWLLRLSAWFSRFDSLWTSFGDQGIAIRRSHFDRLGGFPAWPIFEDVELLRRARRAAPVVKLAGTVTTSAARYQERGVLRQQILNAWLILRFLTGMPPERIAAMYERESR